MMEMKNSLRILILVTITSSSFGILVWPQYTVFQITTSVSIPIVIPNRKVYFDWGFQMNYDMPFNDSFTNVALWPGLFKRSLDEKCYRKYGSEESQHHFDVSAGEIYNTLEDYLISYGYHETCLLKSVCELAKHPFDFEDNNLLAELVHFLLSPSIHHGFADNELHYKEVYEAAEEFGKNYENCEILYPECKQDLLKIITSVKF